MCSIYGATFYSLYRPRDVGKPKVEVAANFIKTRLPDCNVTPYPESNCMIMWMSGGYLTHQISMSTCIIKVCSELSDHGVM